MYRGKRMNVIFEFISDNINTILIDVIGGLILARIIHEQIKMLKITKPCSVLLKPIESSAKMGKLPPWESD